MVGELEISDFSQKRQTIFYEREERITKRQQNPCVSILSLTSSVGIFNVCVTANHQPTTDESK